MKKVFTIFFLLTCLGVSAAVPFADSLKHAVKHIKHAARLHVAARKTDSPKTKTVRHPDTTKTFAIAPRQKGGNMLAALPPADSAKQAVVVIKKDSTLSVVMVDVGANPIQKDATQRKDWYYTVPAVSYVPTPATGVKEEAPEPVDNNPPVTSLIQLDSLRQLTIEEQVRQANLRKLILRNEQVKLARVLQINDLDSLKLELKTVTIDTIRALLYSRIAQKYMDYDTLSDANKRSRYQNAALNYTLLAIHQYSLYDDSVGLRDSYANLSKVYYAQRKYTEAKWFILQANTLSRARNDTPNVISSLLTLAAIKSEIQDYNLAMGDLNEAMQLSENSHMPKTELEILKSYALLYSNMQDYPKEEMVLKKRNALQDSINKAEQAQLARAAALKKKQDALNKKKQYLASLKKPSKTSSPAKVASL